MKIDIHVHASERSGCSVSSEHEMICTAIDCGLDALAFTDHACLVPAKHLEELNKQYAPFRIFSGVEITTAESEDVLIFGVQNQRLESLSWEYADLHRFVHEQAGFIVLAHPYRYRDSVHIDTKFLPPDAIETRSCNIEQHTESRIRQLAQDLSCAQTCASDAHEAANVGKYFIRLGASPDNDRVFVSLLKARDFRCEQL